MSELQTPLTPIEEARLHYTCRDSLTPAGMMLLRRLSFEKDRLKGCDEAVKRLVESGNKLYGIICDGMQRDYDEMTAALGEWRAALAAFDQG